MCRPLRCRARAVTGSMICRLRSRRSALLCKTADEAVCLETPIGLGAIGFYYRDFHQMTDAEVTKLLARAPLPN